MKQKELENPPANSLLDLYNGYHPEFLSSLHVFAEPTRRRILKKLQGENDRNNFRATIAEIRFGKLFLDLGFEIDYDRAFPNKQTPDWALTVDGSSAIADVYRLGKSRKDQIRSDFEDILIEKLERLARDYVIRIRFVKEYFDPGLYEIDVIVQEVDIWLSFQKRDIGARFVSYDNFIFEVVKNKTRGGRLYCNSSGHIDIKLDKIVQTTRRPNEITKKLSKYKSIISDYDCPYVICVSIDFGSGLGHEDFKEYFRGREVEFADFGEPIASSSEFNHVGKYWTELGEFYNNPQLTAIVTLDNNVFRLLINPSKQQTVYSEKHLPILNTLLKLTEIAHQ